MRTSAAFSGKPDGLSFSRTRTPVAVVEVANGSDRRKGTKSVVIHSPCACAGASANTRPLASSNLTGKLASKYQLPRASPLTVTGLVTTALGSSEGNREPYLEMFLVGNKSVPYLLRVFLPDLGSRFFVRVRQENQELITGARLAAQVIRRPHMHLQSPGDLSYDFVPAGSAILIVQHLEVVDVDENNREDFRMLSVLGRLEGRH